MEHKLSKVKVYQTTEYKRFRFRPGNRDRNAKKQEKIIAQIKAGNDILDECPIIVFEVGKFLDIDDGQNRFEIAQKLQRPVHYIIKEKKLSLYELAKINSNTEKWSPKNYVNCYASAGNEHYIALQKFLKTYGFPVSLSIRMLTHGINKNKGGGSLTDKFERGDFQVMKAKEARIFAETCKNFSAYPGWKSGPFVDAVGRILVEGMADMEVMMRKFNAYPHKLTKQSSTKDYLNNLQQIYNIDNSKQKPIY